MTRTTRSPRLRRLASVLRIACRTAKCGTDPTTIPMPPQAVEWESWLARFSVETQKGFALCSALGYQQYTDVCDTWFATWLYNVANGR